MRKQRLSRITGLIVFFMIFSLFFLGLTEPVFARDGPDVKIYIHGEKSNGGPIFNTAGQMGKGLWAPGVEHSGIMRIYNNYSNRISIHNLGINMRLYNTITDTEVQDSSLFEEFAKNMKLTIKKGRHLLFGNTIYDKSFYEMLFDKGNPEWRGYDLGIPNRINIAKEDSVDLEYTVHMDENAGNNMQGLKAIVDFVINSQENPYDEPSDDEDDDDDKDRKDTNGNLIEEPVDVIPDIGGHWAHDCIAALIKHGVLDPDSNGSIRPEDYITRAEAAVLIGRALELEPSNEISTGYVDAVPAWARGYIISTGKAGVFKGYPGMKFKPNINITREEMVAVLIRAFKNNEMGDEALGFKDNDSIAKWARGYVASGAKHNIITGYPDNTFKGKGYITRAEAFTIVCKLLGYHDEHNIKL